MLGSRFHSVSKLSLWAVLGGLFLFLNACAAPRPAEASSDLLPPTAAPLLTIPLPDQEQPVEDASRRASWLQYHSGMQALETQDWLEAQYYFDLAMDELLSEMADSSVASDSVYFRAMPLRILSALELVYPHLSELGVVDSSLAMASDLDLMAFPDVEDEALDSSERVAIESYLDTLDLSRFSLKVELNERVMKEIHYLTKYARNFTEGTLSRKTAFESMIREKLRARNMPEDLMYLSFVESGFKIKAYSPAKASGLWQFIPATGRRYGLENDYWVDMRRNPEMATDAALDYLSALYKEFGDWHLAMAAYNCGEGRIRRLLKDAGSDSLSYWELKLPRETMHYVPRILAAMIIGHFPEHYNFKVEPQSLIPFDTVTVDQCLPLENAAQAVGVGVNTIKDLNLELNRYCTPPNKKEYVLRIPEGTRDVFLEEYAKMDKSKFASWQQHRVRPGENIARVARNYGLRVADILQANNLKKKTRLKVGQMLVIPMPAGAMPSSGVATDNIDEPSTQQHSGARYYTVKRGDNLGAISRRFGVSVDEIKEWNRLPNARIRKGQRLVVQAPKIVEERSTSKKSSRSGVLASGENYTVRSGDTYFSIANTLGVEQEALMALNGAEDSRLQLGQVLKIPSGAVKVAEVAPSRHERKNLATDAEAGSYEVRDGDNLYSISRRLGVSLSDLKKWNKMEDETSLKPGQKLVVKDSVVSTHTKAVAKKANATFYVVRNGDNLWDIARKFDVTVKQISGWNQLSGKKLKPGMRLKVSP